MYTPQHFQITDPGLMLSLMREFSFATIVTAHHGVPFATHMPITVESERLLSTHIARNNPQWTHFESGKEILIVFQGDHSFVSPSWYEKHPSVPTWNYMTVHAYGRPRIVEEGEAVKKLLHKLVLQYESEWDMLQLPKSYLDGMIKGIVAFEIEVTRLEGKFKLSQNRTEGDRASVIARLSQSPNPSDRAIARAMKDHNG
jgi:transcriptional regulator